MSQPETEKPKEGLGVLVLASCMAGFIVGLSAGVTGVVPPLIAFLLIPAVALLYAFIGRFVSEPFCSFIDWAVGDESSFQNIGVTVAIFWPMTPVAGIPLLIYGCIRRMF